MDLHRRKIQLFGDHAVLDRLGLVDRLALEPLGGERTRRDGRAAAERLELGVLDLAVVADLDLEAHHVAARRRADEAGAHAVVVLVEGAHVARVLVVLDDFIAVCHDSPDGGSAPAPMACQCAAHCTLARSIPSLCIS